MLPTPWLPEHDYSKRPKPEGGYPPGWFTRPYHVEDVRMFFAWLLQNYKDTPFTKHELAERLDVHRVVIEEWHFALERNHLVKVRSLTTGRGHITRYVPDDTSRFGDAYMDGVVHIFAKEASQYNPWINREWDKYFYDIWYPYFVDMIVDKYYNVEEDEVYLLTGKRHVKDGKAFYPLINKRSEHDHPIYLKAAYKKKVYSKKTGRPNPPPIARKEKIEALCFQNKAGIRKRGEEATRASIKGWLPSTYFGFLGEKRGKVSRTGSEEQTRLRIRKKGGVQKRSNDKG